MTAMQFDPVAYKRATTRQWQNAAKAWSAWGGTLREWLGPATEIMIDSAEIREGASVLDVAAGAGDQSMQVADRVGPDGYAEAMRRPHTREFDITGRPMKGWVMVVADGYAYDAVLQDCVRRGVAFAQTLDPE